MTLCYQVRGLCFEENGNKEREVLIRETVLLSNEWKNQGQYF